MNEFNFSLQPGKKEYNKIEDERSDDNGKYKCYYEN